MYTPAAAIFDSSQNLWVTNCSDENLNAGTITEFTAMQLANLGTVSDPTPNISLVDDGHMTIFHCPWGEQLATSGNPPPAVFLDSDSFGLNIDSPTMLTFGPIP
jgi:hypothetical protein